MYTSLKLPQLWHVDIMGEVGAAIRGTLYLQHSSDVFPLCLPPKVMFFLFVSRQMPCCDAQEMARAV